MCAYNVCCYSFGSPGTQKVQERFRVDWHTYLASTMGIVVAFIDGRGSSCRGNTIKFEIYKKFGQKEIEDQVVATRYINFRLQNLAQQY